MRAMTCADCLQERLPDGEFQDPPLSLSSFLRLLSRYQAEGDASARKRNLGGKTRRSRKTQVEKRAPETNFLRLQPGWRHLTNLARSPNSPM
jgi:hypothetical protein